MGILRGSKVEIDKIGIFEKTKEIDRIGNVT